MIFYVKVKTANIRFVYGDIYSKKQGYPFYYDEHAIVNIKEKYWIFEL